MSTEISVVRDMFKKCPNRIQWLAAADNPSVLLEAVCPGYPQTVNAICVHLLKSVRNKVVGLKIHCLK